MRVKRGTTANKRRKKVLKMAKGYKWGRSTKYKAAKDAVKHALGYAFRDRKVKKRTNRALWQIRINAAVREHGMSYSKFIGGLKKVNIQVDRKVLSDLAANNPKAFGKIVEKVK